jgi:uroporphyrinogen decarboxylase
VPFIKVFGGTNAIVRAWENEYPGIGQSIDQVLQFEGVYRGWERTPVNVGLSQLGSAVTLEEGDTGRIVRHSHGLVEWTTKGGDYRRRTLEWPVKCRSDWERVKAEHLQADDPERFPEDWDEYVRAYRKRDYPLQLTHGGVYGFARNLMGDEALGYAFYDDPDLVHEIMDSYTEMAIQVWGRILRDVDCDLVECWEDMASKNGSLISPRFFREFMRPNYQRIAQYARDHDIEIILVDSDGNIMELTGLMLEAGVTALYPYEVQAGNDVAAVLDRYPGLGVLGGLDKNVMAKGRMEMDQEIEKARLLIRKGRYIPGPDHFVLSDVSFPSYRYFMGRLRQVVLSTTPEAQSTRSARRAAT